MSTLRIASNRRLALVLLALALAAPLACGSGGGHSGNGGSGDVTLPPGGTLRGLAVASADLPAWDSSRGAPPPAATDALAESGLAPSPRFGAAVPEATVRLEGATTTTSTALDGTFFLSGLEPGDHVLHLEKTVDGNLVDSTIPVHMSRDSGTAVLVEMSAGGYRVSQRYRENGRVMERILAPDGATRASSGTAVSSYALPGGATYTDANGDGTVDGCTTGASTVTVSGPAAVPDDPPPVGTPVPPVPTPPAPCTIGPVERIEIQSFGNGGQLIVGQTFYFAATGFDHDGNSQDVTSIVTWTSSKPGIADIDDWGAVTGTSPGHARITASLGSVTSAALDVDVVPRPKASTIFIQNLDCFFVLPASPPVPAPGGGGAGGGGSGSSGGGTGGSPGSPGPQIPPGDLFFPPSCTNVILVGDQRHFAATGLFGDSYYQDVTQEVAWNLDPSSVATIAQSGALDAKSAGDTNLTASLEGVTSDPTAIRVVTQPTLTSVEIYTDFPLPVPLTATPAASSSSFLSSSSALDAGGGSTPGGTNPTPPPPGTTEPPPDPPSFAPCPTSGCIPLSQTVLVGDTVQFHALARYDTGLSRDVTSEVEWTSSAPLVGLVGPAGKLLALSAGNTNLNASLDGITSDALELTVVKQATALSMWTYIEGGSSIVKKDESTFLHATASYDVTGLIRDVTNEVTWDVNESKVATVSSSGELVGRDPGFVTVTARLGSLEASPLQLEVWQTSNLNYCDPNAVNRATWSDDLNRVTLETDCASYSRGDTVTMRYTIDEIRPNPAPLIDPCLDLFVYSGDTLVRTVRDEGCGNAVVPAAGAAAPDPTLYQTLAFWDQRDANGEPVSSGSYRIEGRFYIYYDPVVDLTIQVR